MAPIPLQLWEIKEKIREAAADRWGLDFFETIFEIVDYKKINEIAAYGGFPTRYPHWRFGMEYEQLSKPSLINMTYPRWADLPAADPLRRLK